MNRGQAEVKTKNVPEARRSYSGIFKLCYHILFFSIPRPNTSTCIVQRISSDKASNLPKRDVRFILLK